MPDEMSRIEQAADRSADTGPANDGPRDANLPIVDTDTNTNIVSDRAALEDSNPDTEDAVLADADLFDDENDLVSLDDLEGEDPDDVIGEDDDNPFEESDEALPDDSEERAIARDNSHERTRFDEI